MIHAPTTPDRAPMRHRDQSGNQIKVLAVLRDAAEILPIAEIARRAGVRESGAISAITDLSTEYPVYEETEGQRVRYGLLDWRTL